MNMKIDMSDGGTGNDETDEYGNTSSDYAQALETRDAEKIVDRLGVEGAEHMCKKYWQELRPQRKAAAEGDVATLLEGHPLAGLMDESTMQRVGDMLDTFGILSQVDQGEDLDDMDRLIEQVEHEIVDRREGERHE